MRSLLWRYVLVGSLWLVAACAPAAPRGTPDAAGDLLFLSTPAGLSAINPATGGLTFAVSEAVAAPDWSRLFTSTTDGQATRLVTLDGLTGAEHAAVSVQGGLAARVVSGSGRLVALAEPKESGTDPWLPAGRERTTIVVAHPAGEREPRRFELTGNYEPEAFSADDRYLFVIEYLPAATPDRYRVRRLDLATGQVSGLLTRSKLAPAEAEEEMRGTGRMQVWGRSGGALYTLYTRQPDHLHGRELVQGTARPQDSPARAFVHVLSLAQGWAFCLDLPEPFGQGAPSAMALALSPDSQRLYVVDRSSGLLAVADTGGLEVERIVEIGKDPAAGEHATWAQVGMDGALYVASSSEVLALDGKSLAVEQRWQVAGPIAGLGISPDGRRLYLGLPDRIAVLDATTGRELGTLAVSGVEGIEHVGTMPLRAAATR